MNKSIIAELNSIIAINEKAYIKYRSEGFLQDIKNIEKIITFVKTRGYNFLSLNEAVASGSRT